MADRIEQILMAEHGLAPGVASGLRADDLRQLRAAALDRRQPYRGRAMEALVAAGDQRAAKLLQDVLLSADEDPDVRAAAAGHLGRLGTGTERALATALGDAPPQAQFRIADALARVGGRKALPALESLEREAEGQLREQAAFARTVIAHRHGLSGHEPPVPPAKRLLKVPRDRSVRITVAETPPDERARALASLGPKPYGLSVAPDLAPLLECAGEHLLPVLARKVQSPEVEAMRTRPMLAGLVALRAQVDGSYSVRWLVLSWPGDGAIHVALHRPSGRQVLYGEATEEGGGLAFTLRSVKGRGQVPVEISGRVERGLDITKGRTGSVTAESQSPAPLEPPLGG